LLILASLSIHMKSSDDKPSQYEEIRKWHVHGSNSHWLRKLIIGGGLCTLFCILLFAKLSAVQAYAVSAAFLSLGGYAIFLGFRD
jgi:hypothetical protein